MKTIIVWFRNDLRLHDNPALRAASEDADYVVPLFILNDDLLQGRHAGSNRNRFLLESLDDMRQSLRKTGADLVIRSGSAATVLKELAADTKAEAVYYSADFTPYAIKRDKQVKQALEDSGTAFHSFGGRLIVDQLLGLKTKTGQTYKVFTPFWKNWMDVPRRAVTAVPRKLKLPTGMSVGSLPKLTAISHAADLSKAVLPGGETAGRQRMTDWLSGGVNDYHQTNNQLTTATSLLSPYLHFGCISARELEANLPDTKGARAFNRQLCWRDFYNYILLHFPANARQEFQERYRELAWSYDKQLLTAWQEGKTGYPVVDAGMRQLNREGWMHNRARLIVGSFLTKDLGLDWRLGEKYFMRMLLDGDEANNNGNWQWIASVGVDPAPVFRRLYNPMLQQQRFDADGSYVRQYVPELAKVPDKYLAEPWKMPLELQHEAGCIIGKDYPEPVVDHKLARQAALERYRV